MYSSYYYAFTHYLEMAFEKFSSLLLHTLPSHARSTG